mgnify:CR=1 FL=1
MFFFIGCLKENQTEKPLARVGSSVLLERDIDNSMTEEKIFDFVESWITEKVLIFLHAMEFYLIMSHPEEEKLLLQKK